ncbi:MAG: T9SS type A sorting domain-containing protein [Phaeodactylibacter sp.]|nr:T9SS type A sorting domain-containing protein [Phaeodactylibacter sp.]
MKKIALRSSIIFLLLWAIHPQSALAQSDQYLHFDRVDDYVLLNDGSQYIANASAFSMAGWYYTDQLAYGQGMMGFRGNNGFYLIQLDNGIIECRFHNSTGFYEYVAPAFSILPEAWQHIAWVYDGTKVALYINGVLKGSSPASGTFELDNVDFAIGKSILAGFNFYFGGRVDELSVWTKALTPADIQDMMENELTGDEQDLQIYYKFNQGVPGEDNTSITKLKSETGNGERDADLLNFALNGPTSNFGGMLDVGFQAITFPQIPNKLTSAEPFELQASASSGLSVSYEVVSGPASVNGNTVTLDGTAGEVVIKASQPGNGTYEPAEDILNTFQVLDPNTFVPVIDARNPLAGDVYVPELSPIQLAAIARIDYPELFSVSDVYFQVNGEDIQPKDWGNGHYTGWWTPPAYGSYTVNIISANNYGASATESVNINIVQQVSDINDVIAATGVWLNSTQTSEVAEAELPSYLGAFDQVTATLQVSCPSGGCGPWDRVAWVEAKGHNGQWVEIFRYITPYGTPCSHTIDLTDYMSTLQGKIAFRLNCETLDNGFLYELRFDYKAGTPAHKYSAIDVIWDDTYPFGDPANLQPVEERSIHFPNNAVASTLKLVSSGHGWGDNNTGNAAEFHDDTHHIWVNGAQTFEQHNWQDCNPNPDGCQPQNGTWFYDRAGWCPGAIAHWFDYDMTPFISNNNVALRYVFDEDYVDNCHPNNPNCISGTTCPDCNDGFNPHLIVACNLVVFADGPVDGLVGSREAQARALPLKLYPNPSNGLFNLELNEPAQQLEIRVLNSFGQLVKLQRETNALATTRAIDLQGMPKGLYWVEVRTDKGKGMEKVVVE